MKIKSLAIWGLIVNAILTLLKIVAGVFSGSVAILAEGIHSGADVFSSGVAIWGIKKSEKPADKKHPYGYARYESLASLVVVFLLIVGAGWIIYEAISSLIYKESIAQFTIFGIIVMIISIVLNEIMARLKFRYGSQQGSQVLVADGQHDRADVIASIAVLIGLILVKWIPAADAILAILVGLYILYECIDLTKESVESLVDTANLELEKEIGDYLRKKDLKFDEIKTRKIGSSNFAEISLLCDSKAKVEEVDSILNKLKNNIIDDVNDLTSVTLSVKSHAVKSGILKPVVWGKFRYHKQTEKEVGIAKKDGRRIIIPLSDDKKEISKDEFGTGDFMVVDVKNGKINKKEIIKNPYFSEKTGKGMKFAKQVEADKIITKYIGKSAQEKLKKGKIELVILGKDETLEDVVNKLED